MKRFFQFLALGVRKVLKSTYRILYYYSFAQFAYASIKRSAYISPRARVRDYNHLKIGSYSMIRGNCQLGGHVVMGEHVRLGYGCHIFGRVTFGSCVMVAPNVIFAGGEPWGRVGQPNDVSAVPRNRWHHRWR